MISTENFTKILIIIFNININIVKIAYGGWSHQTKTHIENAISFDLKKIFKETNPKILNSEIGLWLAKYYKSFDQQSKKEIYEVRIKQEDEMILFHTKSNIIGINSVRRQTSLVIFN
ncbi:hypothetical protein BpHYR1_017366 [Brachionus plicatilis]|uniref:Uncharacterized protein n=1 Tax=Brachionus plicatilis TaxID=10195 RepID=A0A3M7QUM4_BRAPC|nr:hypothetical protein BpHYR1_017366 [Brachionus plicatilis]